MTLARDGDRRLGRLFSGHESDGRRHHAGHHAQAFLAADGTTEDDSIARLIVAAPWAVDHRAGPRGGEGRRFAGVVRRLTELNAGRLGRFEHLVAKPICDGDPLLGPATTWVSRTPYLGTRNLRKRDDPASTMEMDVRAECRRRGLPVPVEVGVPDVDAGTTGRTSDRETEDPFRRRRSRAATAGQRQSHGRRLVSREIAPPTLVHADPRCIADPRRVGHHSRPVAYLCSTLAIRV